MNIQSAKQGESTVVAVQGRMDISTSQQLEEYCNGLLDAGEQTLIIDLAELEYVSSAGLRVILSIAKKLKATQGSFALCRAKGAVKDVLSLSGIAGAIPVHESVEECLAK